MVLRDKLYSFTAKQGRPIQQQYHHYKDGKASATYVTAQSRVSAHGNGEISRGRDACLGYVKRQMAFDASVMFLGLHIALSDIFHFLHACLCCRRPQGVSLFAPWVGFSLRCSCAACGLILFLRQRYIFFGPSPRALLCSLHRNTVGDRDVENIVLEEYRRLLLWVNQTYSVSLDLYVLQMLPCTWRRFIRLVRRGRELSEAQWRSLFLTSQNRSLRLQLHSIESRLIQNALDWLEQAVCCTAICCTSYSSMSPRVRFFFMACKLLTKNTVC